MNHVEGNFAGVRNSNIYYQGWVPEEAVRAILLVVHGLGEHCGRYMNLVNHFVPLGYAVYGLDHVGHGKSDGAREVVESFEDYTNTLTIFYGIVRDRHADSPIFMLGHSMGGLIAPFYLLDHQADFQGAVLSAPSIKGGGNISKATIIIGKLLAKYAPRVGLLALEADMISRDPEVVNAYLNDPLVFHGKTPARLAAELLQAMTRVTNEAHRLTLPLLIVQGTADALVDPAGARMLHARVSSADKTLLMYEGLYHEVFNEPERNRVLGDVERWLAART